MPTPASRGSRFLLSHASSTLIFLSRHHRSSALSLFLSPPPNSLFLSITDLTW
ncbi:predicted protein [Arabidopsis lyrata subsp. lyrata]|uniref:Predicted protein n=1 Tax=Arabidopsis lyrata subsp. lyrata TaxID=81972 RepID=D7LFG1_ARALL|nr:predicted protein [Arabidopsis lyrata subsp. lyrata]